jgi:hypothetical protein
LLNKQVKIFIDWMNAIKHILQMYYKNFIFQCGTTTTFSIRQKSQDFCWFGKSLRHCLIKTLSYDLWTSLQSSYIHTKFSFKAYLQQRENCFVARLIYILSCFFNSVCIFVGSKTQCLRNPANESNCFPSLALTFKTFQPCRRSVRNWAKN